MTQVSPARGPVKEGNFLIFLACFLTIFAEGVGFGVRTDVLGQWSQQFGFTKFELGTITGGGLVGFGVIILIASLFLDRIGYKPVLLIAFVCHAVSGVMTLAATPIFHAYGKDATFQMLYWSMFLFAVGNGLCEGACNPLVATLYPRHKTKYLNILHASWPLGLVVGALIAVGFVGKEASIASLPWEFSMSLFLIPVVVYGVIVLIKKLPMSEARAAGVTFGTMAMQFASPLMILLLILMAGGGYVELGTDSWITNIMNAVINHGLALFIYMSILMVVLRFFAGHIVHRINPLGLLAISTALGFTGLTLLGTFKTAEMLFVAGTVYACGKTFIWPTLLGVVGERFPKGGALTMGAMGGVGMLAAGLLGGPGIGYNQDYGASHHLQDTAPQVYERYAADSAHGFLFFPAVKGLDGAKVGVLQDDGKDLTKAEKVVATDPNVDKHFKDTITKLGAWWETAKATAEQDKPKVQEANIAGGQLALRDTAYIHLTMFIVFVLMVIYFRSKGGYKQIHLDIEEEPAAATADM